MVNELLTYSDIHLVIPMRISMLSLKTTVQPKHKKLKVQNALNDVTLRRVVKNSLDDPAKV